MAGSSTSRGKGPGLDTLLTLPAFLFSVFVFYWSLPLCCLFYRIRFLQFSGPRNDVVGWAKFLVQFFGVKIYQLGDQQLYKGGPCVYLANHRSWADFFVDNYLTEGRAAFLARWMVFVAFPVFCSSVIVLKGIVFFKRTTIKDKHAFNKWLDEKLNSSWVPGFLVYPEGHRSLAPKSLPLRRGMLHYAYGRKLPVQVVIAAGKEGVMSEKSMTMSFGAKVLFSYSKVIKSTDFSNFEEFWDEVESEWNSMWTRVYSADIKRAKLFVPPSPQEAFSYPLAMRVNQLLVTLASMLLLGLVCYGCYWGLLALLLRAGPVQQVVAGLLASWLAISMMRALIGL